eukprot:g25901.t2
MQNVTALGPKNPWTANLLSALGIMHFNNEEIKETFDTLVGSGQVLPKIRLFEMLKAAYGFEPMPEEMGLFVNTFHLEDDAGELTWPELEAGFDEIREVLSGVSKNATEYISETISGNGGPPTGFMKDLILRTRCRWGADDGNGWFWLVAGQNPGGLYLYVTKSPPFGERPLALIKEKNVEEFFEKVNWHMLFVRLHKWNLWGGKASEFPYPMMWRLRS